MSGICPTIRTLKKTSKLDKRLIILSDIWGLKNSDWVSHYVELLKNDFDIQFYDCCELGNVDTTSDDENVIHNQFVQGGIDRAVANLLKRESGEVYILAFSIGGLIAWKASKLGLAAKHLFLISSTRLRYEIQKPDTDMDLLYAGNDPNIPAEEWFERIQVNREIYEGEEHTFYRKKEMATTLSQRILKFIDF